MEENFYTAAAALNGAGVLDVKAMETIRNWNDWLGYDCTFTPQDHQGMKSTFISKCGPEGQQIKISDWMTYKGE